MTTPRIRSAAFAGSMALLLSLAAAPAATMAQDGPEAAIEGFMDAVVAKDFEAIPGFFCEDEAEQAARFDITPLTAELPPMLLEPMLESFAVEVQLDQLELISESDTEALVRVVGSLEIGMDPEPLLPLIEMFLALSDQEVTDESIEAALAETFGELETQTNIIEADVTLVPGDERWLICSDLSIVAADLLGVDEDEMDDGMSNDMDEDMDEEDDGE